EHRRADPLRAGPLGPHRRGSRGRARPRGAEGRARPPPRRPPVGSDVGDPVVAGEGRAPAAPMKRPVLLRPGARAELVAAWGGHEARRAGRGGSMVPCVEAAVAMAARPPEAFQVVHGEVRRVRVRRFPYGVYYVVEDDALVVLAI